MWHELVLKIQVYIYTNSKCLKGLYKDKKQIYSEVSRQNAKHRSHYTHSYILHITQFLSSTKKDRLLLNKYM